MHSALAFDTYSYVRKLRDAGMDEEQAVIQTEALVDLVEHRLASKHDVAALRRDMEAMDAKITALDTKLDAKITALDTKLDAKITALDTKITDILKWTAGIFAAQTALIIGA
ncbi:MAG: CCDC90 family protein, partial [Magnetococcus sp. YQC-5]